LAALCQHFNKAYDGDDDDDDDDDDVDDDGITVLITDKLYMQTAS